MSNRGHKSLDWGTSTKVLKTPKPKRRRTSNQRHATGLRTIAVQVFPDEIEWLVGARLLPSDKRSDIREIAVAVECLIEREIGKPKTKPQKSATAKEKQGDDTHQEGSAASTCS